MAFVRAKRSQAKLRLGLIGPSGSGKTYSSLSIASGLGRKIALLDTEHSSASLYSDVCEFDVQQIDTYEVEKYIEAIEEAGAAGYDVLVIDSLSHAWAGKGGILEFVDKAAKRSGNNFAGWRDATPRHNALIDAILAAPLHIICTLRSKVEHVVETVGGRTQVRKVGMQPVQRDGLEYEFTVVGDLTQEHDLIVTKSRAAWLADQIINKPGEALGKKLLAWLDAGEAAPPPELVEPFRSELFEQIRDFIPQANKEQLKSVLQRIASLEESGELSQEERDILGGLVANV